VITIDSFINGHFYHLAMEPKHSSLEKDISNLLSPVDTSALPNFSVWEDIAASAKNPYFSFEKYRTMDGRYLVLPANTPFRAIDEVKVIGVSPHAITFEPMSAKGEQRQFIQYYNLIPHVSVGEVVSKGSTIGVSQHYKIPSIEFYNSPFGIDNPRKIVGPSDSHIRGR
jgi:hypothetical protein